MDAYRIKRENMELLAEYRETLVRHPQLTYLFFELTDACNLSCVHCGSHACPNNHTYLSYENIDRVMTEVAAVYPPNTIMICLTGGEPMLHPDLYRIIERARELGFLCGMTSNATLMDVSTAARLKQSGLQSISVSLDGTEELHDSFRGKTGAFANAVQGIRNLVEIGGIVTQITTVFHKGNFHLLADMFRLADALQVDSWRPINLEPIGRARKREDLLLNAEEMRHLLEFIREKRFDSKVAMEVTFGCSHYLTLPYERMVRDQYFLCGAGIFVGSVLCNGDIYACLDIERRPELIQGNIETDSFPEVWEKRFEVFRNDRSALCEECRSCSERTFCRGDAAHTWDYDRQAPLICLYDMFKNIEGGMDDET